MKLISTCVLLFSTLFSCSGQGIIPERCLSFNQRRFSNDTIAEIGVDSIEVTRALVRIVATIEVDGEAKFSGSRIETVILFSGETRYIFNPKNNKDVLEQNWWQKLDKASNVRLTNHTFELNCTLESGIYEHPFLMIFYVL